MAYTVHVPGASLVRIGAGEGGALADLGYCRNGVDLAFDGYYVNVPGDENGGDEGPPIEVLQLGQTARVRLEMTKWDSALVDRINSRVNSGIGAGVPPTTGTMMFGGGFTYRLLILPANYATDTFYPYNFLRAFTRAPIELPQFGSKFSIVTCEFECHKLAGVLFNRVTI